MDFRFAAHDPRTGEFLRIMPRPVSVQIGDTFGTRGTLVLSYAGSPEIETFLEVRAQVSFGGEWEQVGPALLRLGGSHEDTDASGMRTIEFVSREWVLGKARVGEGELPLVDGKRPFYQASPGEIMRSLLLEAQDRGAAQGIELGAFDAATDSAGTAWSKVATIYYSPGLPIASVLENLVDQGMCDYRMNGRTLELFEPDTAMGRDLTVGDPVRIHGAVTEAPVAYTLEDLTTSALLIGEEGFQVEVANPSAPRDYGELEVTIEQGGVNSEATARTMIDAELQRGSREIREITRSQAAAHARHLPFRDYRVGDYVEALDNGRWERYRVCEVQIVRDGDGWTVHTVLNDRLQELLLKLAKRTSGIVNGSKGSGGDGTPPAPAPRPGLEPAAPQGLVVDQQVYIDGAGDARGLVTAGWGEVTESTRGQRIDLAGYELWRRDNETHAPWRMVARTDSDTEATDAPVWLTRSDGSAAEYQWRVRAVAQQSGREGAWSEPVTLTMTQDTTPPPLPSAPVVSTGFRIVSAEWDGLTADGTEMPSDFARVRVYTGTTESMSDARQVGSILYPGTWNSETMPAGVQVWVAFTAVDRVGNESAMTAAVSVTPQALVDEESISAEVERIGDDIDAAAAEAAQELGVLDGKLTTAQQELVVVGENVGQLETDLAAESDAREQLASDVQSTFTELDTRLDSFGDDEALAGLRAELQAARSTADSASAAASAADQAASAASQAALEAAGIAASKGRVIIQDAEPTGADRNAANIWIKPVEDDPETEVEERAVTYVYLEASDEWIPTTSDELAQAAQNALDAREAAAQAQQRAETAISNAASAQAAAEAAQQTADDATLDAREAHNEAVAAQEAADEAAARAENLVADGGFEFGGDAWELNRGSVVTVGDPPREGSRVLRSTPITSTGGEFSIATPRVAGPLSSRAITAVPGERYALDFDMRVVSGTADPSAYVGGRGYFTGPDNNNAWPSFTISPAEATPGEWVHVSGAWTIREGDTQTGAHLWGRGVVTDLVVEYDNVRLRNVTEAYALEQAAEAAQQRADEAYSEAASKLDESQVDAKITASANGKNSITISGSEPSGDGVRPGDIWWVRDGNSDIYGQWTWTGSSWVARQVRSEVIANLDVHKLQVTGEAEMDSAVIEKLWVDGIEAKTITAASLTVAPGNLIPNGTFERGEEGWRLTSSSVVEVSDPPAGGSKVLRTDPKSGSGQHSWGYPLVGGPHVLAGLEGIDVQPGDQFRLTASIRLVSGTVSSGSFGIRGCNSAGTGDRTWPFNARASAAQLSTGEWVDIEGTFFMEPGRDKFGIQTFGSGDITDAVFEYDDIRMVRKVGAVTIENGAIGADQIRADEVGAEVGEFVEAEVGNLKATKGTVGEAVIDKIWADGIAAKAATFGRVTVGSGNLLPDLGAAIAADTHHELGYWGNFGIRTNDASFWAQGASTQYLEVPIVLKKGVRYRFEVNARTDSAGSIFHWQLVQGTMDAPSGNTAVLDDPAGMATASYAAMSGARIPGGAFAPFWAEGTAPEDMIVWSRFHANYGQGASSTYSWFQNPTIRPMTGAVLIEDGAVTAAKVRANAITAGKIATGAVTAGKIAANAVRADEIAAGAIDGKIITGATVRTVASGARVQLNTLGIRAYDAAGATTFSVHSQTGAVFARGDFEQRNSYGSVTLGPQPYSSSTSSPGLAFDVPGQSWWGPGGVFARNDPGTGFPETRLQGFVAGESDGSSVNLAAGNTSTGSSTYLRRGYTGGGEAGIWLTPTRQTFVVGENIYVDSESTSGQVMIRKRNTAGSATGAFIRVDRDGAVMYSSAGNSVRVHNHDTIMNGIIGRYITGPSSSMLVGNGGVIGVEGSSRRWKTSIDTVDAGEYEDGLLSIDYSSWLSREDVEKADAYRKWRDENPMCPTLPEYAYVDEEPVRQFGVIAEQLDEAGVPGIVGYDEEGLPATVNRANIGVALVPIVKRLRDRVAELEARIGELDG